jgi:hypothetical protein
LGTARNLDGDRREDLRSETETTTRRPPRTWAVDVLYGFGHGLRALGNRLFRQGPGLPAVALKDLQAPIALVRDLIDSTREFAPAPSREVRAPVLQEGDGSPRRKGQSTRGSAWIDAF